MPARDDPPDWLLELADAVCRRIVPVDTPTPIGCHTKFVDGVWEMTVFTDRTEEFGGAHDGRTRATRFFLDLTGLTACFDRVERFAWQPVSIDETDDLGPHVAVEGVIAGHPVWLRVLSDTPRYFDAGRYADLYE